MRQLTSQKPKKWTPGTLEDLVRMVYQVTGTETQVPATMAETVPSPAQAQPPAPIAPPTAAWARFTALSCGSLGGLMPREYLVGFSFVCLVVLAVDVYFFEPWFKLHGRAKTFLVIAIMVAVGWSGFNFIKPAKLQLAGHIANPEHDYRSGISFAGIVWKPGFSDLRVNIKNQSALDYESVDLLISTDQSVVQVGQLQANPICIVSPNQSVSDAHIDFKEDGTGKEYTIPQLIPPSLSMDSKYKVMCDKMARGSEIQLVIATANMGPPGTLSIPVQGEEAYGPTRHPKRLYLSGRYTANERKHAIDIGCDVGRAPCSN
jgi:hypothetical protein